LDTIEVYLDFHHKYKLFFLDWRKKIIFFN